MEEESRETQRKKKVKENQLGARLKIKLL